MPLTLKELSEKRVKLVADARGLHEKAKSEKRSMTALENEQYEKIFKDVDELRTQIDALAANDKRERRLAEEARWAGTGTGRKTDPGNPGGGGGEVREITWGEKFTTPRRIALDGFRASPEYRSNFNHFLATGEQRAMQADVPTTGGYLLAPMSMLAGILQQVDNALFIRQKATVLPAVPPSTSVGVPTLETDVDDADWTSELGTGNEDSALTLGRRELKPHPMAKRIKLSNTLMRATGQAETLATSRLAYKHGVALEKAYMTGSGAQQALGLFTASSQGIDTSRDVSTGNTTTAIVADNLFEVKYSLKPQYQATAEWVFHRTAVKQIRLLKDAENRYVWQPGLTGTPDTLLDRPVNQSEYAPSTFTTGQYVGLFGDLSFYWIVDSLGYTVQRLVELYAATNQTAFIGRLESDGQAVMAEAFARVQLG